MPLFGRKKPKLPPFDLNTQQPAVRRSICTGEITVGYIDRATGKFHDLQMIPDQHALEDYLRQRGANPQTVKTLY